MERRKKSGLTRSVFALQLEIGSERLASYEAARAPLRFDLGDRFCALLGVNQRWLADGTPPEKPYVPLGSFRAEIPDKMQFWMAYDLHVKAKLEVQLSHVSGILESHNISGADPWEFMGCMPLGLDEESIYHCMFPTIIILKSRLVRLSSASQLPRFIEQFIDKTLSLTDAENDRLIKKLHLALTNAPSAEILPVMIPDMKTLLEAVRRHTAPRGAQSRLAEFLKVPTSRVSEWLSGKVFPDGCNTLRLLAWVTAEEAKQQNSPGSAPTPPGPKTRKGSSHENQNKSSP